MDFNFSLIPELNTHTIPHVIKKCEPQLIAHLTLMKNHDILTCLLDLDITEEEMYCLCDNYRLLLTNHEQIQGICEKDKVSTNRLFGVLTDLYVDWFKLKGLDVKQKIPDLLTLLEKYDYEELMQFFEIDPEIVNC